MLELIKVDSRVLVAAADYRCEGDCFIEKYKPFSYDENKLVIKQNFAVSVGNNMTAPVLNRKSFKFDPADYLDSGKFEVGSDYYIYVCIDGDEARLSVSANGTYPMDAAAATSRMIGGFHYGMIRKVSADGTWTPIDSDGVKFGNGAVKWQDNVTVGIVPNSVWDLRNRPRTLFGGLAKVGTTWVSIYQASKRADFSFMKGNNFLHVADGELQSRYGQMPVTGIDGLCQYNFAELAVRSGMRLMKYSEWLAAAYGAPQGEDHGNMYGWCDIENKVRARTGCAVNLKSGKFDPENGEKPYAISAYNIVDTTGNVWEWLGEYTNRHDAGEGLWAYYDQLGDGMGQIYGWKNDSFSSLAAGGHWHRGSCCGARAINPDDQPWKVNVHIGTRLACDSL